MSEALEWMLIGGGGVVLGVSAGVWLASKVRVRVRRQSKEEQVDSLEKKLVSLQLQMETWNKARGKRE